MTIKRSDLDAGRVDFSDIADRFGRFFNMSAAFWLGLQEQYDLETARRRLGGRLDTEVRPLETA